MASSEGGKMDRRGFLKGAGALVLGAVVPGTKDAEVAPKQRQNIEDPEKLKDRNTTIDIAIGILNSFEEEDIEDIASGPIPEKATALSTEYNRAAAEAALVTAGAAIGTAATYVISRNASGETENARARNAKGVSVATVLAGVLGTLVSGPLIKGFIKQPSIDNIKAAEREVHYWIMDFKLNKQLNAQELANGQKTSPSTVIKAIRTKIASLEKEKRNNTEILTLNKVR
jgi:hypothetical protein